MSSNVMEHNQNSFGHYIRLFDGQVVGKNEAHVGGNKST